jgi:hypothetical protein
MGLDEARVYIEKESKECNSKLKVVNQKLAFVTN